MLQVLVTEPNTLENVYVTVLVVVVVVSDVLTLLTCPMAP
jgi:hypothetical protein